MNNSWNNNANTSGGFIYFNTSNLTPNETNHNTAETSDFLSFLNDSSSNGSPPGNHFSPSNYSSPRKHFYEGTPRNKGGRNYHSPMQPMGKNKFWRRSMGLKAIGTQDTSHRLNYHTTQHKKKNNQTTSNGNLGTSVFFEPTCIQDPWYELEQKFLEESQSLSQNVKNKSLTENKSNKHHIDSEGSSENTCSGSSESEEESEEMENSLS